MKKIIFLLFLIWSAKTFAQCNPGGSNEQGCHTIGPHVAIDGDYNDHKFSVWDSCNSGGTIISAPTLVTDTGFFVVIGDVLWYLSNDGMTYGSKQVYAAVDNNRHKIKLNAQGFGAQLTPDSLLLGSLNSATTYYTHLQVTDALGQFYLYSKDITRLVLDGGNSTRLDIKKGSLHTDTLADETGSGIDVPSNIVFSSPTAPYSNSDAVDPGQLVRRAQTVIYINSYGQMNLSDQVFDLIPYTTESTDAEYEFGGSATIKSISGCTLYFEITYTTENNDVVTVNPYSVDNQNSWSASTTSIPFMCFNFRAMVNTSIIIDAIISGTPDIDYSIYCHLIKLPY